MAKLVIVRHGKSEWNDLGLWTGWEDPALTEQGREEAKRAATELVDIEFHKSYSSPLKRVTETLEIIKTHLNIHHIPHETDKALNERHYGIYQGKNKWQIKDEVGEELFQKIRRSWDHPIPEGERMVDVYERVIPYFETTVMADVKKGLNVIVASSNNALRSIIKYLENISNEDLVNHEIGIGEAWIYEIDENGKVVSKEVRAENALRGKI